MKARLEFSCSPEMEPRAAYVLSTLLEIIGIPRAGGGEVGGRCITVHYGDLPGEGEEGDGIFIPASPSAPSFFASAKTLETAGVRRVSAGGFDDLPVLFPSACPAVAGSGRVLPFDIVSSALYFLTNREEVGEDERDPHGRFPYSRSASCRLGLVGYPVVDAYASILGDAIAGLCRERGVEFSPAPRWPEGRDFALCLTHDVDCVRRYSLCSFRQKYPAFNSLCSGSPALWNALYSAQRLFNPAIDRVDPFWAFRDIMDLERKFGFRSSFYFQAGGGSPFDTACYRLEDGDIRSAIRALRGAAFEVGLHGSYDSGFKEGLMEGEVERLSSVAGPVIGQRQHFLRIDPRRSFGIYSRAGLRYDTTLGYADREGWRSGTSLPFNPYDIRAGRPYPVLEIPLTVMEWTLTHYRGLSPDAAWAVLKAFLETARKKGGCFCLLWHVHMFSSAPLRGLYERALQWAAENNGWGVPAGSVYEWWVERRRSLI